MKTVKAHSKEFFQVFISLVFLLFALFLCTPELSFAKTSEELYAEADRLLAQIDELQTDINAEQVRYDQALQDQQAAIKASEEAQNRANKEQAKLEALQKQLSLLVTDMYKNGDSSNFIDVVMEAETFDEFLTQWDAMSSVSGKGAELIREAKKVKASYEEAKAEADRESEVAAEKMNAAQEARSSIEAKQANLRTEAEKITEEAIEREAQEELEREAARQAAEAAEALMRAEAEAKARAEAEAQARAEAAANEEDGEESDINEVDDVQVEEEHYTGELVISGSGLLNHPLPTGTPSSPFGWRELDGGSYHLGYDIAANEGTPYYSAAYGTVIIATNDGGYNGGAGNYIVIAHGNGLVTKYMHSSKVLVEVGDVVERGQKIGEVGNTGQSYGAHLHFQVEYNGVAIDPTQLL